MRTLLAHIHEQNFNPATVDLIFFLHPHCQYSEEVRESFENSPQIPSDFLSQIILSCRNQILPCNWLSPYPHLIIDLLRTKTCQALREINQCIHMRERERETRCALVLFLGCVRMQRGRLVRRGGVQLQDTSAKHCVVILPPRHTVLSHQSESRWLSELWRCAMWNAKHSERTSQHTDSFYSAFLSLLYTCLEMLKRAKRSLLDLSFHMQN